MTQNSSAGFRSGEKGVYYIILLSLMSLLASQAVVQLAVCDTALIWIKIMAFLNVADSFLYH